MRVYFQHFMQWDPQVFMPGRIWQSVSFPPEREITDSEIYDFVAVLFIIDKKFQSVRGSGS